MSDQEKWERIKGEQQSILKRDLAEEIEGKEVTDEEAERIICAELEDEDVDEYLVDCAVLSCTSAVWDDFPLSDGEKVHIEGAEKKTKDDKPTGILRVWENPMYTNGLHHANVTDTKQGLNILPFSCNCMEPATTEQEQKIIEYMDKCKKSGVCQYLMDLEEEWENIDFSESEHIAMNAIPTYKEFSDVDATTSIGGVNVGSLGIGGLKSGRKQGITMTSVLFCKHGGFIYPVDSGQGVSLYGNVGLGDSTVAFLMIHEGNVGLRVNNNGTLTIGYGYDFTRESDPQTFNKYFYIDEDGRIQKKAELKEDEAVETIYLAAEKKDILRGIDAFINGTGAGNDKRPLEFNQNQYDALFSFFYSNGPNVFTDGKYEEWTSEGGELASRAEARKRLKEYLIEENGNYDAITIEKLFVDCKGGNLSYEYEYRRKEEAELFMSE